MDKNRNILKDFCALVQFDKEQTIYVADATGISKERLSQLAEGHEPTASELLAVCSAAAFHDADERCRPGSAREIAKNWLESCFETTFRELNYLHDLLELTGLSETSELLGKFHIFMDGSSLCTEGMAHLLEKLLPDMKKLNRTMKISIPITVVKRLQSMSADEAVAKLTGAEVGMRNLITIQDQDLMVVRGDENDTSVLGTFISAFSKFKPTHSLLLLTNDESMAIDVEKLNTFGIEGDDILVAKVRKDGRPIPWSAEEEEEPALPVEEEPEALVIEEEPVTEEPVDEEPAPERVDDLGWIMLTDVEENQTRKGDNERILVSDDSERIRISEEEIPAEPVESPVLVNEAEDAEDMIRALFGTPGLAQEEELIAPDSGNDLADVPAFFEEKIGIPEDLVDLPADALAQEPAQEPTQEPTQEPAPAAEEILNEDTTLLADVMQLVFDNPRSDEEEEDVLDDEGLEQLMNISLLLNSGIDDEEEEELDLSGDDEDLPDDMEDISMDLDELIKQFNPEWSVTRPDDEGEATYKHDAT